MRYRAADAEPPRELFVKFSRDFSDPARDHGRAQMAPEVRFALLCRDGSLPIAVPRPLFADYHHATGTGILITERIAFGRNGIEPQHAKCRDYELADPIAHYRALFTALGALAGADQAGRLAASPADFPVRVDPGSVGVPPALTPERLHRRLERFAAFAADYPALLPAGLASPAFTARLAAQVPALAARAGDIWRVLASRPELIALCHWNANVDNAWFWRDATGTLRCGLLDWGSVSRLNLAMAVWGSLCSAETDVWDHHLDELLTLLADTVARAGGARLPVPTLRDHALLYGAVMGITWLLDVPALVRHRVPATVTGRDDPRIRDDETVRVRLQMLVNVCNLLHRHDILDIAARNAVPVVR
ncbi:hypothetical protein LV457_18115 [Mycobacterium sp. MYCO198283]|nr:hypothetical protein [Mycobacterium sp. MYCO198283]MCG5434190.1 hypothetical protein [Mycobacterium sp. MYCO198283]